ncbi:DUF2911 domain-containing protein [Salmonirosea aquatica]|uniref:DUF2911 domain-containing protein n=1 Tax=Salmonirosea aquatica TaxID=2654236 RepID=A0A7C9FSE7_9BACT|nr:DUF2911 domain-containing protein [Cytophagaceae bacterium SJW1-29]
MKTTGLLLFFCVLLTASVQAQTFRGLDKSPMDMAYYPDDYAHDRKFAPDKIKGETAKVRVIYSRPALKGRALGDLVPTGKVWRVGANEASEIKFYEDATIMGKKVKAGTYALLGQANEQDFTVILSSDVDQWGAYSYDPKYDVLRVNAPLKEISEPVENFAIQFAKGDGKEVLMRMAWGNVMVEVPMEF